MLFNIYKLKYLERDGINVLTAEKTYSKERKSELKLRKWEPINIDTLKELV